MDTEVTHSYDDIVKLLDADGMSQTCAGVILEALEKKGTDGIDWMAMDEKQREAAKELMVLTHVAEGAVPREKDVSTDYSK